MNLWSKTKYGFKFAHEHFRDKVILSQRGMMQHEEAARSSLVSKFILAMKKSTISPVNRSSSIKPRVDWLICIEGCKGRKLRTLDFCLFPVVHV